MAKPRSVFVCRDCGAQVLRWQGQCPGCEAWNTLEESAAVPRAPGRKVGYAGEAPRLLGEVGEVFDGFALTVTDTSPGARPGLTDPLVQSLAVAAGEQVGPKYGWTDVARFTALGIPAVAATIDGWFIGLGSFLQKYLGLMGHYESLQRGVLDLGDLAYFLSLTAVFLVLNTLWLEGRKY